MVANFTEIISDAASLINGFVIRKGFMFTSITKPANVFDAIVIRHPKDVRCYDYRMDMCFRTLDEHINFINQHKIEKALIITSDISFLEKCPTLQILRIIPANESRNSFSYQPLYSLPRIKGLQCSTVYGDREEFSATIDYSKIRDIESIAVSGNGHINFHKIKTLKTLGISGYTECDLTNMYSSAELDTLMAIQCKISSLNGIGISNKMQCLYLYNNRVLQDISALEEVSHTLRVLKIDNCPKITDFSVLSKLKNIEVLQLSGSNTLPNISFIKDMDNLKSFVFSMNVANGDLQPCIRLTYVQSEIDRRYYNYKNKELPKNEYIMDKSIERWRSFD